jgi:anti-sigma B factor antagonist
VSAAVGDGARWGVRITVTTANAEPTGTRRIEHYRPRGENGWLPAPFDVVPMTHLPGCSDLPLFESYASWFAAIDGLDAAGSHPGARARDAGPAGNLDRQPIQRLAKGRAVRPVLDRRPGVHRGRRRRRPGVIIEDRAIVAGKSGVSQCWVGPDTFVGPMTAVANSLAWGSRLINWQTDSSLHVPDPFLLSSLTSLKSLEATDRFGRALGAKDSVPRRASSPRSAPVVVQPSEEKFARLKLKEPPMKIESQGDRLIVSDIVELTAANSGNFRDEVRLALKPSTTVIEIDLSQTRFMDSSGLGALFALYRATAQNKGTVLRLLNPIPEIQQLLELTQMQQLFEIVKH